MTKFLHLFVTGILVSLLFAACQTTREAGRKFNHKAMAELELGKTTPTEAKVYFGKPESTERINNEFGSYELYNYAYVQVPANMYSSAEEGLRSLNLEFVDNKLNGYFYVTLFDNEQRRLNLADTDKITRYKTQKYTVMGLFGKPNGKAYDNTTLPQFAEGVGAEIWIWLYVDFSGEEVVTTKLLIGFDRDGTVESITTSEKTR